MYPCNEQVLAGPPDDSAGLLYLTAARAGGVATSITGLAPRDWWRVLVCRYVSGDVFFLSTCGHVSAVRPARADGPHAKDLVPVIAEHEISRDLAEVPYVPRESHTRLKDSTHIPVDSENKSYVTSRNGLDCYHDDRIAKRT